MFKNKIRVIISLLLISLLVLSGCSSDGGDEDNYSSSESTSVSGTVYIPKGTELSLKNDSLLFALFPEVKAAPLDGETPLENAKIVIKNFETNKEITTLNADDDGEYTASNIPKGIDLLIIAVDNDNSLRVSGIVPDVGMDSQNENMTGDLNTTTTLVAENLAAKNDEIKNIIPSSLDKTLKNTEKYVKENYVSTGTINIDLTVNGDIIRENIGDGLQDINIDQEINKAFGDPINFEDLNLENAVRDKIKKSEGNIYKSEVASIEEFRAPNQNISDLSGLESLTSLKILDLGMERINDGWVNSNNISDLTPLSELDTLEELLLYQNNISDISQITGLINLRRLSLDSNSISELPADLNNLDKLERLDLAYNDISDISNLSPLTSLTSLDVSGNNIENIAPINNLTKLNWLGFAKNQVGSSFSQLTDLSQLESLYFYENNILDISVLSNFTELVELDMAFAGGSDLSPIYNLNQLEYLNIAGEQLADVSDLEKLGELTKLRDLRIYNTDSISDISFVSELNNLEILHLVDNQIKDVSPIAGLNNLEYLKLAGNPISDYTPLEPIYDQLVVKDFELN